MSRHAFRRTKHLVLIVLIALLGSSTVGIGTAYAGNPACENPHCYSITWTPDGFMTTGTYYAGHMSEQLGYLQSGRASASNDAHLTSEMWVYTNASGEYIEAGIGNGWVHPNKWNGPTGGVQVHTSYESGSGASTTCMISGCNAYFLFWADTKFNPTFGTGNQYVHYVKFLSPSPRTTLGVDIGHCCSAGQWQIHMWDPGLDYYGTSAIESGTWSNRIDVGGELQQKNANSGACGGTMNMTFAAVRLSDHAFIPWTAQAPGNGVVHSGFNGTQSLPAPRPGTWNWNLPSDTNPNGC